jgi:hypothetical protein
VVLRWKADEMNADRYEIRRSSDAKTFRPLAEINAKGNGVSEYTLADPIQVCGQTYYRIRQIDTDGKYSFSRMISVAGSENKDILVYPNPFLSGVTIEVDADDSRTALQLVNILGEEFKKIELKNKSTKVKPGDLAPGLYLLKRNDNVLIKLIKQ